MEERDCLCADDVLPCLQRRLPFFLFLPLACRWMRQPHNNNQPFVPSLPFPSLPSPSHLPFPSFLPLQVPSLPSFPSFPSFLPFAPPAALHHGEPADPCGCSADVCFCHHRSDRIVHDLLYLPTLPYSPLSLPVPFLPPSLTICCDRCFIFPLLLPWLGIRSLLLLPTTTTTTTTTTTYHCHYYCHYHHHHHYPLLPITYHYDLRPAILLCYHYRYHSHSRCRFYFPFVDGRSVHVVPRLPPALFARPLL